MKDVKEIFSVEEISLGHEGDSSVGMRGDWSYVSLSEEMQETLNYNNELENFKKELFELFKKYNDEVDTVIDDVESSASAVAECLAWTPEEEKKIRFEELKIKEKRTKIENIELYYLERGDK